MEILKRIKDAFTPLHAGDLERQALTEIDLQRIERIKKAIDDDRIALGARHAEGRMRADPDHTLHFHLSISTDLTAKLGDYGAITTSTRQEALNRGSLTPYTPSEMDREFPQFAPTVFTIPGIEIVSVRQHLHGLGEAIAEMLEAEEKRQRERMEAHAQEIAERARQLDNFLREKPKAASLAGVILELSAEQKEVLAARNTARHVTAAFGEVLNFHGVRLTVNEVIEGYAKLHKIPVPRPAEDVA